MSTLEDIKKRMDEAEEARRNYSGEDEAEGNKLAYLAEMSSYDVPKLVAALEAVDGMTGKLLDSSDSPPGQDDFNKGIDQGFAIAAKAIRSAIEEALA